MKVSEAKQKVCPFMSLNGIDSNGIAYVVKSKCICGDCMAWVYTEVKTSPVKEVLLDGATIDRPITIKQTHTPTENGYCARIGNA